MPTGIKELKTIRIIIIIIIIIIIKAQRIRRYEKRETQYRQNKMFKEDTKKFYRNLGMKNIEARTSLYGRNRVFLEVTMGRRSTA